MAGLDKNIKTYSQLLPVTEIVRDNDLLLFAQPWAQGLEGYKTVNVNMRLAFDTILDSIHEQGIPAGLIDSTAGLLGTGSKTNPLHLDTDWLAKNYAIGSMVNVSQVGRLDRTTLPLGNAATTFAFPMNGRSMAAFAAPAAEGFTTLVPVTNGFDTTYNYGYGELLGNGLVEYRTSDEVYIPKLPEGYESSDYWVDQIFSASKMFMVIKLRHVSGERSKDELAVVVTNGTFDGAQHTTFFLSNNNLYTGYVADGVDVDRVESKMKYTAFEQDGKLYITRFDVNTTDKTFGNKMDRGVGLVIYQLVGSTTEGTYRLNPVQVTGISTTFLGNALAVGNVAGLTDGYFGKAGSELDLSIVDKSLLEFKSIPMTGTSQAMDRFLDIFQEGEDVKLRLNRTANFFVNRANGTRQNFIVNYGFVFTVDMKAKKITSVQTDPVKYRPKLIQSGSIYAMVMNKQEATLWNGSTGRMEVRCECNLTLTTPTTATGDAIVTQRDDSGATLMSAQIETVSFGENTLTPQQIAIPMGSSDLSDSQELLFISGTESNGYRVGGIDITGDDKPTYTYTNANGELVHGYSLALSRFTQQRLVNGVKLDSYQVNYNCEQGEIFTSLSGYDNTVSETRFGIIDYSYDDLVNMTSKTFIQREVQLDFNGEEENLQTIDIETYVDHRSIREWIKANIGFVDRGRIKLIPYKVGSRGKMFIHMTLVGGIGVGLFTVHCIADCQHNDEDHIVGAIDETSVYIDTTSYNGGVSPVYEQPELHNASVFVEDESGKVAIFYSNFGEYGYGQTRSTNRLYSVGFSSRPELRLLPFTSNFGLLTYYLDKVNGISFTSKDSWLQILHTSEQVPFAEMTPMMARSASAMLLAAPAASSIGNVRVLEPIPFFMAGVNGLIPVQDVPILGTSTTGVFYLYLGLRNRVPFLETRAAATAERPDYTMIAVIRTNPSITIASEPFIRLGNYRLSTTSKGAAIPVTAPRPHEERFTLWD